MATETVTAMVRIRPLNRKEKAEKSKYCLKVIGKNSITILDLQNNKQERRFTFDRVFTEQENQKEVYEITSFSIVEKVFEGYNGTIFAYGQTGCGKTHTMIGVPKDPDLMGVIPRVFTHCRSIVCAEQKKQILIQVSYLEIYNECIYDLLNNERIKLDLKEDKKKGIYVKGLQKIKATTLDEMKRVLFKGDKNRTVGATAMNAGSSRSHSIFTIYIETSESSKTKKKYASSKLSLVDLAGSEKNKKTKATGTRLKEGAKINLSLSALGNVIKALVDGKAKYIPYRDSKLTRLLQDSLGGNTKTVMIAAVSPADSNFEETLSTLRYANRAKNIKNKPVVNLDEKDLLIKQYEEEIAKIKNMMGGKVSIVNKKNTKNTVDNKQIEDTLNKNSEQIREEQGKQAELQKKIEELQGFLSNKVEEEEVKQEFKDREKIKLKIKEEFEQDFDESYMEEDIDKKLKRLENELEQKKLGYEDLEKENLDSKMGVVQDYIEQQKMIKFYQTIINNQLTDLQLNKIRTQSRFIDRDNSFAVPLFMIQKEKVVFTKLPKHDFRLKMNNVFQRREILFDSDNLVEKIDLDSLVDKLVNFEAFLEIKPVKKKRKSVMINDLQDLKIMQEINMNQPMKPAPSQMNSRKIKRQKLQSIKMDFK